MSLVIHRLVDKFWSLVSGAKMKNTRYYAQLLSTALVISLFSTVAGSTQAVETTTDTSERVESVYTSLDLDNCEVIATAVDVDDEQYRCEGYQNIPLYVTKYVTNGDERFDVDAGVLNDESISSGLTFYRPGDTVEWRLHDGEPVAFVLRYNFVTGDANQDRWSQLAVSTIGKENSPGCLIDWVRGSGHSQNVAARRLADAYADGFDCESDVREDKTVELPLDEQTNRAVAHDTVAGFAVHDYLVEATTGQTLQATLRSDGPALVLVLEDDEAQTEGTSALPRTRFEPLTEDPNGEGGWIWEGNLPSDGVYRVRVGRSGPAANQAAVSSYSLTVDVE